MSYYNDCYVCGKLMEGFGSARGSSVLSRWPVEVVGSLGVGWSIQSDPPFILYNIHLTAYPYPPYSFHVDGRSPEEAEAVEAQTQVFGHGLLARLP